MKRQAKKKDMTTTCLIRGPRPRVLSLPPGERAWVWGWRADRTRLWRRLFWPSPVYRLAHKTPQNIFQNLAVLEMNAKQVGWSATKTKVLDPRKPIALLLYWRHRLARIHANEFGLALAWTLLKLLGHWQKEYKYLFIWLWLSQWPKQKSKFRCQASSAVYIKHLRSPDSRVWIHLFVNRTAERERCFDKVNVDGRNGVKTSYETGLLLRLVGLYVVSTTIGINYIIYFTWLGWFETTRAQSRIKHDSKCTKQNIFSCLSKMKIILNVKEWMNTHQLNDFEVRRRKLF